MKTIKDRKMKFSLAEKKLFRFIIAFVLIQLVIIFTYIYVFNNSQQININETKQSNIKVDDIRYYRMAKEDMLLVVAGLDSYLFAGRSTLQECSVHDIYESISVGDQLSLTYYESHSIIWGRVNIIVDAYSETNVYRTLEEYNRGRENLHVLVVILFSIIELIFGGVVFVYVWLNYRTIDSVCKKTKKHWKTGDGFCLDENGK